MKNKRTPVDCAVCGGVEYSFFCRKNGIEYVRCSICNHVYVKTPLTKDELFALYVQPMNYRTSKEKLIWDYSETKEKLFYRPLLNKIASIIDPERLLDIGCSNGAFVYAALHCGWDAYGIELNRESVQFARKHGLKVYIGEISEQSFPSDYFSAITLWQVIEHLSNPRAVLREVVRILKPGGVLAISTPNIGSIGWKQLREDWSAIDPEVHLNLFDSTGLEKLVTTCGLKLKKIETSELMPTTVKQLIRKWRAKGSRKTYNRVANMVTKMSPRQIRILFNVRRLVNMPLKYFGFGEDIYGYFVK